MVGRQEGKKWSRGEMGKWREWLIGTQVERAAINQVECQVRKAGNKWKGGEMDK